MGKKKKVPSTGLIRRKPSQISSQAEAETSSPQICLPGSYKAHFSRQSASLVSGRAGPGETRSSGDKSTRKPSFLPAALAASTLENGAQTPNSKWNSLEKRKACWAKKGAGFPQVWKEGEKPPTPPSCFPLFSGKVAENIFTICVLRVFVLVCFFLCDVNDFENKISFSNGEAEFERAERVERRSPSCGRAGWLRNLATDWKGME